MVFFKKEMIADILMLVKFRIWYLTQ